MKERPILFSAPMVRALLDGRKTQTRRVVKPQPNDGLGQMVHLGDAEWGWDDGDLSGLWRCPYGVPGDRLWVRETCQAEELSKPPVERAATRKERQAFGRTKVIQLEELDGYDGVRYLADDHWSKIDNTPAAGEAWSDLYHYRGRGRGGIGNTVPPIHMPRWASRLTLQITDVRVERLRAISEPDAMAEGWPGDAGDVWPIGWYAVLWDSINGRDPAKRWFANPWVWAVSFEVAL